MNHLRVLASVILLGPIGAFAQPAPAAAAASAPMMECRHMAKHDHGAEKGTPTSKAAACAHGPDLAASAPAKKKALAHDHGKFHKQQ